MEYSIYINQLRMLDWKLTYPEAILFSYYSQEHSWVRSRIPDEDGDYYCIAITKLMKDLPIVGSSKFPFSKALNELVKKQVFEKIVDEDNKKAVFYRVLPSAKIWWKYPEVSLASSLENRNLLITNVIKKIQVLSNDNKVLSNDNIVLSNDNGVLSNDNLSYNYNHITNHITSNHNNQEDDVDSLKIDKKETELKTEFEKILEIYPYSVNNTNEAIAKAFGVFSKFDNLQRFDLKKAVTNYSKTKQVKAHVENKTTNFIQSIFTFITKSYTKFVYGLPENFEFVEEFEPKKNSNGGGVESVTYFDENGNTQEVSPFVMKFETAKQILKDDETFDSKNYKNYKNEKIKALFEEKENEIIEDRMGGWACFTRWNSYDLAEALNDYLGETA